MVVFWYVLPFFTFLYLTKTFLTLKHTLIHPRGTTLELYYLFVHIYFLVMAEPRILEKNEVFNDYLSFDT